LKVTEGFDYADEYSRHKPQYPTFDEGTVFRIGVPKQLQFFGQDQDTAEKLFQDGLKLIQREIKCEIVEFDFQPFTETGRLLYDGPWVAERLSAMRTFFEGHSQDFFPVTRAIFERASQFTAVDTFDAFKRLGALSHQVEKVWTTAGLNAIVVPTSSVTPSIQEVLDYPFWYNTVLGYYTNYVNLLDLCGMAVPNGFLPGSGMPNGLTFIAPAWHDNLTYYFGRTFQKARNLSMGATGHSLPARSLGDTVSYPLLEHEFVSVAVVGAHMSGLPLNKQLQELSAKLSETARTAPVYRLYDITKAGEKVARPGLVRVAEGGVAVELEVWKMTAKNFGKFMLNLKSPLSIGLVELANGKKVHGFLSESIVAASSRDISSFGGWRKYIANPKAE